MKLPRLTIRPLRIACPVLPAEITSGKVLLVRCADRGRVLDFKVFDVFQEMTRIHVHGYTHFAKLPTWLPPRSKKPRHEIVQFKPGHWSYRAYNIIQCGRGRWLVMNDDDSIAWETTTLAAMRRKIDRYETQQSKASK